MTSRRDHKGVLLQARQEARQQLISDAIADVPAWLAAGFQPVEVLRYAHLRVPLGEATAWGEAGFTAYVATGCRGVGMTLDDACALRALPTKQVQEVWRGCGSVAAVLEALAS